MSIKVLHIASSLSGGAGLACLKLHTAMLEQGMDSTVLTLSGIKGYQNVIRVKEKRKNFIYRVLRRVGFNHIYDRVFLTDKFIEEKCTKKEFEAFALSRQGTDFSDYLASNKFDIVNLHWVARQVDLKSLLHSLGNIKIVWTLHDMNPFTAGCTAAMDCVLYKTSGCKDCPQLKKCRTDIAEINFKRKQQFLNDIEMTVVSSSQQLFNNAKNSILLGEKNHQLIPLANFSHMDVLSDRQQLKHDFGVSATKTIIGFGAVGINRPNKGLSILVNALKKLEPGRFQLLIFGQGTIEAFDLEGVDYKYYSEVNDQHQLAMLFKIMDVFISISKQEAFGQTFMEALCHGTPIIGTPTGAIRDFINEKNGLILEERSSDGLNAAINSFKNINYDRIQIAEQAKIDFDPQKMITNYTRLYRSLIK